jgi:hypothetical protein
MLTPMDLKPTTISKKQFAQRWDMLPMNLREALTSERNSTVVWKVCGDEHLSEEKTREVARVVAWVLMGFLHPEDVANEIKLSIDLHPDLAAKIANALNVKIFAPMREELEGTYAPPGTEPHYTPQGEEVAAGEPAIILDNKRPEAVDPVRGREGSQRPSASNGVDATLKKIAPMGGGESFFKETPVSLDSLKFEGEKVGEKEPAPMPAFDLSSFAPEPPPAPAGEIPNSKFQIPNSDASASPFILHEEPTAPSLPNIGDFSLDIKPEEFGPAEPELPPIPQAEIEIGGASKSLEGEKVKGLEEKEGRVVHYGDLRTPLEDSLKFEGEEVEGLEPEAPPPPGIGEKVGGEKMEGLEPDAPPSPDIGEKVGGEKVESGQAKTTDSQGPTLESTEPDMPPPPSIGEKIEGEKVKSEDGKDAEPPGVLDLSSFDK